MTIREKDMVVNQSYGVSFVKNHTTMTGAAINASVNTLKGIKFGRVEDLDYKRFRCWSKRNLF
jgi:hypothetical protein